MTCATSRIAKASTASRRGPNAYPTRCVSFSRLGRPPVNAPNQIRLAKPLGHGGELRAWRTAPAQVVQFLGQRHVLDELRQLAEQKRLIDMVAARRRPG